jgi:DNA-binding response OmpR family regulator
VGSQSDGPGVPAKRPGAAELLTRLRENPRAASKSLDLEMTGISVPTCTPLAVGTVVTVNLSISSRVPPLTALARVQTVEQPTAADGPSLMRLRFVDVWGKHAAEQLTNYIEEATSIRPLETRSLSSVRALVVDDDATYREAAAKVLREAGFDVLTASNGYEGLSAALQYQPAVMLSDVNMPGLDGWQLLRMIRARPNLRRLPVLFLSDLSNEEQRSRGYALGVDDFVAKPFTPVELLARVERALERAQAANEVAHGMRGDLSKIPLTSLLQFAELERRTGVLQLEREGERATLHLRDGAVMRIDLGVGCEKLEGIERFFHVLDWSSGGFELTSTEVLGEDLLRTPTTFALLEHARRHDEENEQTTRKR